MVTVEFDKLVKEIGSPGAIAAHLKKQGFPHFRQSTINYWYSAENLHPHKKYFKALIEIGRMYGIEITQKGLSGL